MAMWLKKNHILIFVVIVVLHSKSYSQKTEPVSNRNTGILAGCSILEGNGGARLELPGYFYSSKRHGLTIALAGKLNSENLFVMGVNAGYLHFIEPSFRDVTFFLNYNAAYYIEKRASITHIFGMGTQIDIGKHGFIQHSVGLGFHQSSSDFRSLGPTCQLKLSLGFYIRKIPVTHIYNEHER